MAIMSDEFDREHCPFRALYHNDIGWTYYINAVERIDAVRSMTSRLQLDAALHVPGLQKTVERAIRNDYKSLRDDGASES